VVIYRGLPRGTLRYVRSGRNDPAVRIDAIAAGDIVKASIGGRHVYGEVLEIRDRVVYFNPLSRAAGWRHASASQIVGHWRRAGRRRGRGTEADDEQPVVQPAEQLALPMSP
jgi:hypothetical protein